MKNLDFKKIKADYELNGVTVIRDIIDKDFHNTRLDRWFKNTIIDLPQSLIEKIIRQNKIKINKKKAKSSYRVQSGDKIEVNNIEKFKANNKKTIKYKQSN